MQVNKTTINQNYKNQTQLAFKGLAGLGKQIVNNKYLNKFAEGAEYNGVTMKLPSMLVLLYGATIGPRFFQATDKHERREVLTRDFLSITSILFLERALSKGFSLLNEKKSGFALGIKPEIKEGTSKLKQILKLINPLKGTSVLSSGEIVKRYSNLENNKNGISDFVDFIKKQGGDLKKVFSFDEKVKGHVENLLGKGLKEATAEEIELGLKNAKKSNPAMKAIYEAFKEGSNKFVKKAKFQNSLFSFISMCVLVPGFMIWIQKFNEKVTKKAVAKELKEKQAQEAANKTTAAATTTPAATAAPAVTTYTNTMKTAQNSSTETQKQAFAEFLGK